MFAAPKGSHVLITKEVGKSKVLSREIGSFDSRALVIVSFKAQIRKYYNTFCSASKSNK